MTKNWKRHEQFKKLGQAITRYNQRTGPTLFNPWYEPKPMPLDDKTLTSTLGNRFARLHRSSKGPRMLTEQWEATGRRAK